MLAIGPTTRVWVYQGPCDMRRSFDRLACMVRELLEKDPLSGHLFVFMNKDRNRMKVLYWERNGYALWYKRLERGTFSIPSKKELTGVELGCILEGIEFEKSPRKVRFLRDFGSPG